MAERYCILTGSWSNPLIWDGAVAVPTAADDVYANGNTVTIDQNVTVLSLRTEAGGTAVAGGGFTTAVSRTVNATGTGVKAGTTTCLTLTGASGQTLTVNGAVIGGASGASRGVNNSSTGAIVVVGNVIGGSGSSGHGINNAAAGSVSVTGNITGATGLGISNATTGTITVVGNVLAGSNDAIDNVGAGDITITGNVTGATGAGIDNSTVCTIIINGNVTGGSAGTGQGINGASGLITVNGNVVGGSFGGASGIEMVTGTLTINGDVIPAVGNAVNVTTTAKVILNGNIQSISTGVYWFGTAGARVVIKPTTTLTHAYRTDDAGAIGAERVLSTSGSGQGITVPLSDQGNLVTAQNKTTGTTLSTPSTITAAAGQLIVAVIATDNESTTDGVTTLHTALTIDGHGATKAGEYTNTVGGAANDGATVSVWYLVVPADITAGATVLSTLNSGKDAKAITAHIFDLDSAYSISVDGTNTLANDAADPGSVTATGILDAPHLWVRGIAVETETATVLTPTAGWTAMAGTGTTGGAAATNVSVRAEFKISNGISSGASDPTLVAADCASAIVGLALSIPGGAVDVDAGDIRDGVTVGSTEGTLIVPAVSDVRLGVDVDDTEGTLVVPIAADVRFGTNVDATTGTLVVPAVGDVRLGVDVDNTEGMLVVPAEADVRDGTGFGAGGTEFTGELEDTVAPGKLRLSIGL